MFILKIRCWRVQYGCIQDILKYKKISSKQTYNTCSVTRRLECLLIILPFKTMKVCPITCKIAKFSSKLMQILNKCFQNGQSVLTVCQSGEISLNLVTLNAWCKGGLRINLKTNYNLCRVFFRCQAAGGPFIDTVYGKPWT